LASDAVYVHSLPNEHYDQVKKALEIGKHVLCESPLCFSIAEWQELKELANKNKCILMDALRTAYSTAYNRMLLLIKGGKIGKIRSIDVTCTKLREIENIDLKKDWSSITAWGPTALLPVFHILGTEYRELRIASNFIDDEKKFDIFTKLSFIYSESVADVRVGMGVKSEGSLIITGTKGYIYVPAPWWKTDYFEIRYENPAENERYFYQLEGEGIRMEIASFVKSISNSRNFSSIDDKISNAIVDTMEKFKNRYNMVYLV
jgi:choline-phosphate cytidylyltransferase